MLSWRPFSGCREKDSLRRLDDRESGIAAPPLKWGWAIAARLIALAVSLATVPLTLKYLGLERYGMWMTISSTVAMFSFADLGMSSGLINLVADAHGRKDKDALCRAVSSAFCMLSIVACLLLLAMASLYPLIPWQKIFNVHSLEAIREAGPALAALLVCFAANLPLGIVGSIQNGLQSGFITNLWGAAAGSVFSLIAVLLAIHFHAGLAVLILGLSGAPLAATACNAVQLFLIDRPWLRRPRMRFISRQTASSLLHIGLMFFCLQLATAIGYQSDNLVIAHLMGARMVAAYAVPSRLFNILPTLIGMTVGPLWPAYAEAITGGDIAWIRKAFRRTVIGGLAATSIAALLFVLFGNAILGFWVGPSIRASLPLLAAFGIRCILSAYLQPLSILLNGIGRLRAQAITAILMSVVNLTLSILLVRRFGIIGAILGTIVAELTVVVIPETIIAKKALRQIAVV